QHPAVGRKRDAARTRGGFGHQRHRAFRRDVVDAVEVELAVVALFAKGGIGEVDVPIPGDHDLRRSVQALAFPGFGQHLDLAVLIGARDAPRTGFASVQAALSVEGIAGGTVGIGAVDRDRGARHPFEEAITGRVAEDKIAAFLGPCRPFGKAVALRQAFEFQLFETLGESRRGEELQKNQLAGESACPIKARAGHFPEVRALISMLLTTCFTPLTFLATLSALDFRLFASTEPASVTTPCFTVTSKDRTPTSWSPASLTRTASLIVSSVICGGSLARQTACIRNSARKAAKCLCIVFSCHCTPVEGIEKAAVLPPVGLHANVQIQIDLEPEQALHFLAGQGAD